MPLHTLHLLVVRARNKVPLPTSFLMKLLQCLFMINLICLIDVACKHNNAKIIRHPPLPLELEILLDFWVIVDKPSKGVLAQPTHSNNGRVMRSLSLA